MPSFMYGAFFVNFLLFAIASAWVVFKSPDSIISILMFLALLFANLSLIFSYPVYFYLIKKKHHTGLEKKVYRVSLKWGNLCAFMVSGALGLRAFNLWNWLNLGLFAALWFAIVMGMLKKRG